MEEPHPITTPTVRPLVPLVSPDDRSAISDARDRGQDGREMRGAILPTPSSEPVPLIGMPMPSSSSASISPRGPQGGNSQPPLQSGGMGKPLSVPVSSPPSSSTASSHYSKNVPPRFQKHGGPVPSSSSHDLGQQQQQPPPLSSFGMTPPSVSPGNTTNNTPRDEREPNYNTYPGRGGPQHQPPHHQQHHPQHGHQQQGYGNYHGGNHPGSSPLYQPISPEPLDPNIYSPGGDQFRDYDPSPPVEKPTPRQHEPHPQQEPPEIGEWRGTGNTGNTIVGLMDNQQINK